jgi:hypothetical protein
MNKKMPPLQSKKKPDINIQKQLSQINSKTEYLVLSLKEKKHYEKKIKSLAKIRELESKIDGLRQNIMTRKNFVSELEELTDQLDLDKIIKKLEKESSQDERKIATFLGDYKTKRDEYLYAQQLYRR